MRHQRFHGRVGPEGQRCDRPGCDQPGEFRAPAGRPAEFDGPGDYRWLCLEHVRAFNAGYDYFAGMSADEIIAAQSPLAGWAHYQINGGSRAFSPTAGFDEAPRWADFADPLDAISARAAGARRQATARGARGFTAEEARALDALGLAADVDRRALRARYTALVRRYHPDRNGGDRSHEVRLQAVVEAYEVLRRAPAFA